MQLKSLLCLVGVLVTLPSIAQVDSMPGVGDSFFVTRGKINLSVDYDTTGTGITWDYSSLEPNTQSETVIEDPTQIGFNKFQFFYLFDTANVNQSVQTGDTTSIGSLTITDDYRHLKLTPASAYILRARSRKMNLSGINYTLKSQYSDPDTLYRFPLSVGDEDSSTGFFSESVPLLYYHEQRTKRVNKVTGSGTIKTPFGSFPCVKLTTEYTQTDSYSVSGVSIPPITLTYRYHRWFSDSTSNPLLTVRQLKVGNSYITDRIEYVDSQRFLQPTAAFFYLPSIPRTNDTVSFTNLSTNSTNYKWLFGDGSDTVRTENPTHVYTASGTYNVTLIAINPQKRDTITLPVVVDANRWLGTTDSAWHTSSNWSAGRVPIAEDEVAVGAATRNPIITADGTDVTVKELTIGSSGDLTVADSRNLTVSGDLTIEADLLGYGVFRPYGSFSIQGTTNIEQYLRKERWQYVGSPLYNTTFSQLSDDMTVIDSPQRAATVLRYEESRGFANGWTTTDGATDSIRIGQGVAVYPDVNTVFDLSGNLISSDFHFPLSYSASVSNPDERGWNLISNPFTAPIDWDAFQSGRLVNIENAAYIYDPDTDLYRVYSNGITVNCSTCTAGAQYIAPWQAFFVRANNATNSISFRKDAMTDSSADFFKRDFEQRVIRLRLSSGTETVVRFVPAATDAFDAEYDADFLRGHSATAPTFATRLAGRTMTVNSLPELTSARLIPLETSVVQADTLTISAAIDAGAPAAILEDKKTGTFTDLSYDSYTYVAHPDDNANRFVLHLQPEPTATEEPTQPTTPIIYQQGQSLVIEQQVPQQTTAVLYDLKGTRLQTYQFSATAHRIDLKHLASGVYVIRVVSAGAVHSLKVVIR